MGRIPAVGALWELPMIAVLRDSSKSIGFMPRVWQTLMSVERTAALVVKLRL